MAPIEFLRALWPDTGLYCLATPRQEGGFRHIVVDSIEDAARFAERYTHQQDIYFCMHTLKERRRANPAKSSGYETRTHANMQECKCFFFDLDVGAKAAKYETQSEAVTELQVFCKAARLPKPMLTSSGGGIHVFWRLTDSLASLEWKVYALKLKALAVHHKLKHDPSRVSDQASVLRVAGTFNLKDGVKRPVKVLMEGAPTDTQDFLKLIDEAVIRAGIPIAPVFQPMSNDGFESNLTPTFYGPPASMKALLKACPQIMHMAANPADQTQPSWYAALGVIRFVEDGDKYAHKFSDVHRKGARTDEKLAYLKREDFGPTTCTKLADVCGIERCQTCSFFGKISSPLIAARRNDEAPAPVVEPPPGTEMDTITIPKPPTPWGRLEHGRGITYTGGNKENESDVTVVYDHDLHPLGITRDLSARLMQHSWRVYLPHEKPHDFVLDASMVYDRRLFTTAIANEGVYPDTRNLQHLQDYMIAYIKTLQDASAANIQFSHLGWTEKYDGFILPDKMITPTGARSVHLTGGAITSSDAVGTSGTLERQVELMQFYNRREYVGHQFIILAALAAPIFFMTGHAGVVVNASGDPGSSKTTAVYAGASFWGDYEQYTINGTNKGATALGRQARIDVLANLPICVDEITHMPVKDQIDMVMGITQFAKRTRADRQGGELKTTRSHKSTIMVCAANSSLHSSLSLDNTAGTAGSMRVVEIVLPKSDKRWKPAADAFLRGLRLNYGHIGPAFMKYVVEHLDEVRELVETAVLELDRVVDLQAAERFWSAEAATAFVAGRIASRLGLLPFNVDVIERWFVSTQISGMRDVVVQEYRTPISILAEFLEHIDGNMLVLPKQSRSSGIAHPIKSPRGELLARYELDERTMWVLRSAFKDYCNKSGASTSQILKALKDSKVVHDVSAKKVLGANCPEYSKAQTYCICIDMAHRDMSGVVDLKVVGGTQVAQPTTLNQKL